MRKNIIRSVYVMAFSLFSLKLAFGCAVINVPSLTKFDSSECIFIGKVIGLSKAQTKKRIIVLMSTGPTVKHKDEVHLELVEIKIAGQPIAPDKPFDADDNWLKNMTLRVKNVGTKPIAFFEIGGSLFRRLDEELAWDQSLEYVMGWNWGKKFKREKKPKRPGLKPGESVELTYANADSFHLSTLAQVKGEGAFCKLEFAASAIEYIDGTEPDHPKIRFPKPH